LSFHDLVQIYVVVGAMGLTFIEEGGYSADHLKVRTDADVEERNGHLAFRGL
jgi:hypothetical protein